MSAMLTLYYARGTCALASHIALEHTGADYAAVRIDFASQQQRSADYLRINPKGRVPTLLTERGKLTETPAILQYVAQRYPAAKLAPLDDPFELARMNAFNSYLCATVHVAHATGGAATAGATTRRPSRRCRRRCRRRWASVSS